MKKIFASISILIITLSALSFADAPSSTNANADADKPKIAVYVTGGNNANENDALGAQLLNAIVRSGRYTAVERSDVFLAEIDREHMAQRSGAIDDAQISRLGMQAGVQYVCVAVITQAFDSYQVSARILDVETAKVVMSATADGRRLRTMSDLNKFATRIVEDMFGREDVRRVSFGARLAYNNSYVSGVVVDVARYDEDAGIIVDEYDGKFGAGHGFSVGGVVLFNVWEQISVSAGVDFVYRTPSVTDVSVVSEFAIGLPVLVRWAVMGSPLYVEAGAQVDIPFGSEVKFDWSNDSETIDDRKAVDVGIAVGAGYFVTKNISVDIRGIIGVTQFDDIAGRLLNQVAVGVSYLY